MWFGKVRLVYASNFFKSRNRCVFIVALLINLPQHNIVWRSSLSILKLFNFMLFIYWKWKCILIVTGTLNSLTITSFAVSYMNFIDKLSCIYLKVHRHRKDKSNRYIVSLLFHFCWNILKIQIELSYLRSTSIFQNIAHGWTCLLQRSLFL